jgi:hypothetical protein
VSHDRLTRLLQADWPGQTLLELAWRTLFVCERGYLIIDDTVIPKPFASAIEGLAWVFSSRERKPVYGFSLVLLVWTNGTLRIPLSMWLWCRNPRHHRYRWRIHKTPHSFVEVSRIKLGVSSGAGQFATSITTSFTSVRSEAGSPSMHWLEEPPWRAKATYQPPGLEKESVHRYRVTRLPRAGFTLHQSRVYSD